ncbi:MAG TPA: hypothetical protein V6D29_09250 [Leptolyngbyaceae cyanobacterium]
MKPLQEAMRLVEGHAGYTLSSFQKLTELRDTAPRDEAAHIGRLVESFIAQAPPDIVKQILTAI